MRRMQRVVCVLGASWLACESAGAAGGDEQKIRDLDAAWSQAADGKDAAKCASVYAETGSFLPQNAPIATGRAQIEAAWAKTMKIPGYSLTFKPTKIEVSRSRDMAYDVGTFLFKMLDDHGNPVSSVGKYVVVWKKQPGGAWKVQLDIFNADK
ncbi:MAG TPA: DUF4440 domain-containing protein [Steroidobacteraceae bacterium]|nr:DUF4440 domain-containing protein [Steroidobacteraceae bacterium]